MPQPTLFWVIGGDPRYSALAHALAEDGHNVHTYALDPDADAPTLDGAAQAGCVILPLPPGDGEYLNAPVTPVPVPLVQVLHTLRPGQLVCAGRVDDTLRQQARERGLVLKVYFAREELAVANAVPTALAV